MIGAPGPGWLRKVLLVAAGAYLLAIFLGSIGSSLPRKTLPAPLLYFSQVACLFPHAARMTIEYRATGYSCEERRFRELDHRPYFPIHPDDKENRYHRVAHFYRRNKQVMNALDEHLVERHNSRAGLAPSVDGLHGAIGGIEVMSLRIPLPQPGTKVERYEQRPLADLPRDWRKYWYRTPKARREQRCSAGAAR